MSVISEFPLPLTQGKEIASFWFNGITQNVRPTFALSICWKLPNTAVGLLLNIFVLGAYFLFLALDSLLNFNLWSETNFTKRFYACKQLSSPFPSFSKEQTLMCLMIFVFGGKAIDSMIDMVMIPRAQSLHENVVKPASDDRTMNSFCIYSHMM